MASKIITIPTRIPKEAIGLRFFMFSFLDSLLGFMVGKRLASG